MRLLVVVRLGPACGPLARARSLLPPTPHLPYPEQVRDQAHLARAVTLRLQDYSDAQPSLPRDEQPHGVLDALVAQGIELHGRDVGRG